MVVAIHLIFAVVISGALAARCFWKQRQLNLSVPPVGKPISFHNSNATDLDPTRVSLDDIIKFYTLYRQYMNAESSLINNRMTWLLTINGFLYASLSLTVTKQCDSNIHPVIFVLCFVGTMVSILCLSSIVDAKKVAGVLEHHMSESWTIYCDDTSAGYFLLSNGWRLPDISAGGLGKKNKIGSLASRIIPWILVASWLIILLFCLVGLL